MLSMQINPPIPFMTFALVSQYYVYLTWVNACLA